MNRGIEETLLLTALTLSVHKQRFCSFINVNNVLFLPNLPWTLLCVCWNIGHWCPVCSLFCCSVLQNLPQASVELYYPGNHVTQFWSCPQNRHVIPAKYKRPSTYANSHHMYYPISEEVLYKNLNLPLWKGKYEMAKLLHRTLMRGRAADTDCSVRPNPWSAYLYWGTVNSSWCAASFGSELALSARTRTCQSANFLEVGAVVTVLHICCGNCCECWPCWNCQLKELNICQVLLPVASDRKKGLH